jgi:hypothetical protein
VWPDRTYVFTAEFYTMAHIGSGDIHRTQCDVKAPLLAQEADQFQVQQAPLDPFGTLWAGRCCHHAGEASSKRCQGKEGKRQEDPAERQQRIVVLRGKR